MTSVQPELNVETILASIENGAFTRDLVVTIAKGFLPIAQEDFVRVLAHLTVSEDAEIAALARQSIADIPPRIVLEFAMSEQSPPQQLVQLFNAVTDPVVLEALIRNRVVPDDAVAAIARNASPALQDVIVINQSRILRAPQILDALLENSAITSDARRRALETREEFFEKKTHIYEVDEPEPETFEEEPEVDAPLEAIADLLERAQQADAVLPVPVAVPISESEKRDPKKFALWARLSYMTVGEKVQLAFKGDRMIRMLLVRERNKLIASAVMRNPRMTDQEVENIAGMRNVDEEVLRMIGVRRDWSGKYNVMLTLCRNPKTPVGIVLPFINRLTLRDLKGLKDDKGVTQVVRETAKKFYLARTQKTG